MSLKDILLIIGTFLAAGYVLVNALAYIIDFYKICPDDIFRLKYDMYKIEDHKINTYYSTIGLLAILFIGLFTIFKLSIVKSFWITIGVMIIYVIIIHQLDKKRKDRLLTININDEDWYYIFHTGDEYFFRIAKDTDEISKLEKEFICFKKEELLKKNMKYKSRSKFNY